MARHYPRKKICHHPKGPTASYGFRRASLPQACPDHRAEAESNVFVKRRPSKSGSGAEFSGNYMGQRDARLCSGDLVEVRTADEIFQTLDAAGALDHLPF